MAEVILEAQELSKTYTIGERQESVLEAVSMQVTAGEFVVIAGASGSGKTTLLSILSGLDRPSSGRVIMAGRDITELGEDELAPVRNELTGFVFQAFHLVPSLNALENVMFPAELKRDPAALEKASSLLTRVGLWNRRHNYPQQLSGGEKQRVAICRALINNPRLIFADEPTGNLDSENSRAIIELLLELHRDYSTTLVMATHNLEVTAPDEKNTVGRKPSESGTCGSCHLPHNAMGAKLWAKNRSADSSLTLQMCTACHNPNGAAKAKLVGGNDHPVEVKIGEAATAGELPLYDGEGNKKPDAQIACMTCHEPHRWAPRNTESGEVRGLENREGTAVDSFLRRANAPSSLLCSSCHTRQAALQGSAHDMGVSAPAEKNLRDQRPAQSGQCGACHLVHNSPGRIRLWARPLGPVATTANILDSLCTSCHSKGNVAEKKIPSIATHPRERLLINTVLSDKTRGSYTPVFDGSGQRVDVGDIACPSCHDTHRWGFLKEKTASSEKPQPTGASKFLRTASRNTVCVNCHGPEALFRYLYFHQPETRILRTD